MLSLVIKGKARSLGVARSKNEFCQAFETLGEDIHVPDNITTLLEQYVCCLYGQQDATDVNNARYRMFKLGKVTEESLPPNSDSLQQHILRVNFESYIRKHSTIPIVAAPSPVGYGWKLESDELAITWGTLEPAPDSILEYVSCKCKKGCQTRRCSCHKAKLKCTELCQCNSCENAEEQELNEMASELIDGEIGDEEMDCDDDEYV